MNNNPSLDELEHGFISSLRNKPAQETMLSWIDSPQSARRLSVYRNSALGALRKALAEIFPVCEKLVGEVFFTQMAHAYIELTDSRSADLLAYGQGFPAFMRTYPPLAAYLYLPDVAALDWSYQQVVVGENAREFDPAALASIPTSQTNELQFELVAHAVLLESPYPISAIWQSNQPEYVGDGKIDLQSGGEHLIIYRPVADVYIDRLTPTHYRVLQCLRDGKTLGEVINTAQLIPDDIQMCLAHGIQRGYITNVTLRR